MVYYYPNKPVLIRPTSQIVNEKSEDKNWWAEIKKNGTRLCLWKSKEESNRYKNFDGFIFWNRHKELLTYTPSKELLDELRALNIPDNCHIDAELLHQKTKDIKHLIYVYDIYIYKGKQLFESLEIRRNILEDLIKNSENIVLAKKYENNFKKVFDEVTIIPENEGLVIKNKNGMISWNLKKCVEVAWQFKIRKPTKNYKF